MKRARLFFISIMFLPLLWYCGNSNEPQRNSAFHVYLDDSKLSVDLKLSDLVDNCRLIPLETTNESVLGSIRVLNLSGDYILIADRKSVYKFSSQGKFIRKLFKNGRGPGEISGTCNYFYDKSKNLLFFTDNYVEPDYIRCFDVNSEIFLPSIKKCFQGQWLDFIVYQDSLIMGSVEGLFRGETNPYAAFIQNFDGKFIEGIKSTRTFTLPRNDINDIVMQRFFIYTGDGSIHVKYRHDDTLFTFKDGTLSVYLIPEYRNKPGQPNMMPSVGDKQIDYDSYENPTFMFLRYSIFTGWTDEGAVNRAHYSIDYYILNKLNGNYALIQSYYDDLTGKKFKLGSPGIDKEFPRPQTSPDGLIYNIYYPMELSKMDPEIKNNAFKSLLVQLDSIKRNQRETDNPILLIGNPKKSLRVLN